MQGTNKTCSQNLCVWACDEVGGGAEGKGDPGKQGSWWPGCYGNHCIPLPCDWCCWYEQGSAISVIIQHLRHEHCGHRTHTHTHKQRPFYIQYPSSKQLVSFPCHILQKCCGEWLLFYVLLTLKMLETSKKHLLLCFYLHTDHIL